MIAFIKQDINNLLLLDKGLVMPRETLTTIVKPSVFKWLRESAGWSKESVAQKLDVSLDIIGDFELGHKELTFRQLQILSAVFKRPVAAFLLNEPKAEKALPKDYRLLPNKTGVFEPKTIFAIRKARKLQEVGRVLLTNMNNPIKAIVERIDLRVNPEGLAQNYREKFSLSKEKQTHFKTPYEFFNYLRGLLEDLNILVLQLSMPVEDARGFVLMDENPVIIVVNTKDTIEARLFSLMHELAHILLGESVIDLPDVTLTNRNNIESWCNNFAAAFLLPPYISAEIFEANKKTLTDTGTLNKLSTHYKVSKAVLLVSMLKGGYILKPKYDEVIERYKPVKLLIKREKGKKSGSVPSDRKCLAEVGNKFVSLVAHNFDRDFITYSDALNYLSIKSKSFEKVLSRAKK